MTTGRSLLILLCSYVDLRARESPSTSTPSTCNPANSSKIIFSLGPLSNGLIFRYVTKKQNEDDPKIINYCYNSRPAALISAHHVTCSHGTSKLKSFQVSGNHILLVITRCAVTKLKIPAIWMLSWDRRLIAVSCLKLSLGPDDRSRPYLVVFPLARSLPIPSVKDTVTDPERMTRLDSFGATPHIVFFFFF